MLYKVIVEYHQQRKLMPVNLSYLLLTLQLLDLRNNHVVKSCCC